MARGKNATLAGNRADVRVAIAEDERRQAVVKSNKLERIIALRDSEIVSLKEALTASRSAHTKAGTYTESDLATLRAEAELRHRNAVRRGFDFLNSVGPVKFIPMGRFAELVEAFACEPVDILGEAANTRKLRRTTVAKARLVDEAAKQGVL